MKVRRLAVALAALGLFGTAACGSGSSGSDGFTGDGSKKVDAKGQTLTVWIMEGTNPDAKPFFSDLSAAFTKQTGAKLDVQYVPWAEAHDKFVNSIAGGTTPDVAEVGTTWTPEFADAGALMDLNKVVDKAGLRSDLVPGLVDAGTIRGKLYGMPWYAGVRSIIYRTDVFKKAGITTPPTTWAQLVADGDTIKKAEPKMTTFPVAGDSEYGVYPFIWGNGGQIAEQSGKTWKSDISSTKAQQGISFYTDLAKKHGFSTPAATTWDEADLSDAFSRGDVAMMIAGSWTPGALVQANPDLKGKIGAFPIPGPHGGVSPSFLGGSHLSVFNTAKNPDLAWALVKMMTTGRFAQEWSKQSGFFPGTKSLLAKVQQQHDPVVAPFATQMVKGGASLPVTPLYGQVQGKKTVSAMLESILSGKASVSQASDKAAQEMDDVFTHGS
ncbi:MAG: sugar ABC transporter substrate-binding protein [Nocardioidaceae bacterium]